MPSLALADLQHLNTIDPSGRLLEIVRKLEAGVNNVAVQTNAAPVGVPEPPPQVSAVNVQVLAPGIHQVNAVDNAPVRRGITYHFEMSTTPNFQTGTFVLATSGPSRTAIVPTGAGPLFWRAYSQYMTSDPSAPTYAQGSVDAGGGVRSASLGGTGSGTEPSVQPQGGAGFGSNVNRLPRA